MKDQRVIGETPKKQQQSENSTNESSKKELKEDKKRLRKQSKKGNGGVVQSSTIRKSLCVWAARSSRYGGNLSESNWLKYVRERLYRGGFVKRPAAQHAFPSYGFPFLYGRVEGFLEERSCTPAVEGSSRIRLTVTRVLALGRAAAR